MADYCWDCAVIVWGCKSEENDLKWEEISDDQMYRTICEGCGPGWFDRYGKRLDLPGNEVIDHPEAIQHPLYTKEEKTDESKDES